MERVTFFNDNPCLIEKNNERPSYIDDWTLKISHELKSLNDYTENLHFNAINSALRNNVPVDYGNADIIKNLDKIFDTMPAKYRVKAPETVYRGVNLDSMPQALSDILIKKDGADNCFTDKAFVSTSFDKQSAKTFKGDNGIILKITLPKDSQRLDINELSCGNLFLNEQEVLLPRNSEFRVDSYNPETRTADLTFLGQKKPLPTVKEQQGKAFETESYISDSYSRALFKI